VIIVATKKDLKEGNENSRIIEKELKESQESVYSKYSSISFIAAKKHKNIESLQSQILENSISLLNQCKIILPKYYLKMTELIRNFKDEGRICCTIKEVIIQGTKSPTTCLHFLNDIGYILFNSIHEIICVNIPLFAKAMAYIIEPKQHLEIMFGRKLMNVHDDDNHESSVGGILSHSEVKNRCNLMLLEQNKSQINQNENTNMQLGNEKMVEELVLCFQEFDFCFEMSDIEKDLYQVSHIQVISQ
jgi:hypothetical protein